MADFTPRAVAVREFLVGKIAEMLDDLGNPPLVDRIFPNGWSDAPTARLEELYDLCGRTYQMRVGAQSETPSDTLGEKA